MSNDQEYFIREYDIDVLNISLKLHQKFIGDVGCVVWDASIVLAKYLEEIHKRDENYFRNLNVIELGSGVGCVGLTAACLGANVLLTDLPEILPLLIKNLEANSSELEKNKGTAQALSLPWGQVIPFEQKADLILLADCIYYKESINSLLKTMKHFTGPKSRILMAQELRESPTQQDCWKSFLELIKTQYRTNYIPSKDQHSEFQSDDIVLIELFPL